MSRLSCSLAIVASIGVSFAAMGQLVEPRTANERVLVEAVSKSIASCFTTLGAKRMLHSSFNWEASRPSKPSMVHFPWIPSAGRLRGSCPGVSLIRTRRTEHRKSESAVETSWHIAGNRSLLG
jgi:hypothetical protein